MGILNSGDIILDGYGNIRVIYRPNFINPDWYETGTDQKDIIHFSQISANLGNIQTLISNLGTALSNINTIKGQVSTLNSQVSFLTPLNQFKYNPPNGAPVITSVSPANGSSAGGYTVTINGSGFTGATAVTFGLTPATNIVVVSDSQITATAPAGSGSATIHITTPIATSS